ncbi:MAG: type II pantothenate kinase [Oscillospiraceae bacterium]|nr:type II pantothenate kinase [Oscillospiraceae bacterium]
MGIIFGIDIGGSTTKIVGIKDGKCIDMLQVRAADQITSLYGALGKFLRSHELQTTDVEEIYLTGVGASFIDEQIYGIKTYKESEFNAIGRGALFLTGLPAALVVSMGTGTAFVRAGSDAAVHIGGTGIGGGTIIGLASKLLGKSDVDAILALAGGGNIKNVDLTVGDIFGKDIESLPSHLTAANFGKIESTASKSDIALGIINMVFETVGMMAVLSIKNDSINDVVLTGTLATFPQAKPVFDGLKELTGINFIIPEKAVFATAMGAISR